MNSKLESLTLGLYDADRRFSIAISKMNEITIRVHEIEVLRNLSLRHNFIINEIKTINHKSTIVALKKELKLLKSDESNQLVYLEIAKGYRSMSNRKNELEEERNYYVKEIEAVQDD
jgi:hypothetical protein